MELPNDFPHTAPEGYRYEAIQSKSSVIAIWTVFERGFNYNDFNECFLMCVYGLLIIVFRNTLVSYTTVISN